MNKVPPKDRKKDIEFLRMALNLCELPVSYEQSDLILRAYTLVKEKQGNTNMDDALKIYYNWKNHWDNYFQNQNKL